MAKIAILSFYSGITDRGVETFAYEIAQRLSQKHTIVVFQAGSPHLTNPKFKTKQIKTKASLPTSAKGIFGKLYLDLQSLRILLFTLKTLPQIYKGKYNLIIPLNGGWQTAITRIVTKITGAKMLISGHAGIGSDDAWNLLFRPDVFVALTLSQWQWAQKLTPEVRVERIPNGVDVSKFNPSVKPVTIPLTKPVIICTSALVPYKRVDLTIKAVAKTNCSLLVLGDGELRGQIDSLGKRLLPKRYLRLSVPHDQTPSYYKSAQVFTLASKTEAFGISYIEAMACNLPVVTTNDKSREEIIGQAGILTDPTNIQKYANHLQVASKTNFGDIPTKQASQFTWTKVAEKYAKLIETLVK